MTFPENRIKQGFLIVYILCQTTFFVSGIRRFKSCQPWKNPVKSAFGGVCFLTQYQNRQILTSRHIILRAFSRLVIIFIIAYRHHVHQIGPALPVVTHHLLGRISHSFTGLAIHEYGFLYRTAYPGSLPWIINNSRSYKFHTNHPCPAS